MVDMNILTINIIFALFVISGNGYSTEAIQCGNRMHTFYIYDESVCKTTDPCEELKEQINALHKICTDSEFNTFSHLASVLSSGKYARYVIRKYQRTYLAEILQDAVIDYSPYPSNLAGALGLVLAQIYKRGIYYKGSNYKNIIMICTGTELPNMGIVQELINEAFMNNVPVYTFGIGNNVQEDVLKKMSSPPHEKNKNYFLQLHNETLLQILHEEAKILCDSTTFNDEIPIKEDKEKTDSEGNDYSEAGDSDTNDGDTDTDTNTDTYNNEEATVESTDYDVQHFPDQDDKMDTINSSGVDMTENPEKVEEDLEGFGILGFSYIFWILLLLLLIFLLLFTGIYFLFLNKNAISKSDAPDEEEEDENPSLKNTDSARLDVSPSRRSNKI